MTEIRHHRIAALIAAYGADRARWPEAERRHADDVDLSHDAAWREASALDARLAALESPMPSPQLRRKLLLAVAREPRDAPRAWFATWQELWRELGGARIAAPALAMALCVGVGLDWAATTPIADGIDADAEDLLALVQFEETYPELDP